MEEIKNISLIASVCKSDKSYEVHWSESNDTSSYNDLVEISIDLKSGNISFVKYNSKGILLKDMMV